MAYQIRILDTAHSEIDMILNNLKSRNDYSADRFYSELRKCYITLSEGVVSFGLSRFSTLAEQNYHSMFFNDYVLLYFEEDNVRIIAHIFHQRQDYAHLV